MSTNLSYTIILAWLILHFSCFFPPRRQNPLFQNRSFSHRRVSDPCKGWPLTGISTRRRGCLRTPRIFMLFLSCRTCKTLSILASRPNGDYADSTAPVLLSILLPQPRLGRKGPLACEPGCISDGIFAVMDMQICQFLGLVLNDDGVITGIFEHRQEKSVRSAGDHRSRQRISRHGGISAGLRHPRAGRRSCCTDFTAATVATKTIGAPQRVHDVVMHRSKSGVEHT